VAEVKAKEAEMAQKVAELQKRKRELQKKKKDETAREDFAALILNPVDVPVLGNL
jgi:hypothetical protein